MKPSAGWSAVRGEAKSPETSSNKVKSSQLRPAGLLLSLFTQPGDPAPSSERLSRTEAVNTRGNALATTAAAAAIKPYPKKKKKKRQQAPKVLTFKQCTGYCFSPAFRKSFVRDALPPASKRRAARSTPEKRQVQNKAPRLQVDQTKILPASSPEQQPELFSPLPAQARRPPSLPHPPSRAPTSASPPRSPPSAPQRAARGRASAHLPLPYT